MNGTTGRLPELGAPDDCSPRSERRHVAWTQRLLALARVPPVGEPPPSTLETFFAGVRWSEEVHPGGERTLRRASM